MNAFEIVTITVAAIGAVLCLTAYFRPSAVLAELGRTGSMWFDRAEEQDVAAAPADDAVDAPIVFKPLRGRLK